MSCKMDKNLMLWQIHIYGCTVCYSIFKKNPSPSRVKELGILVKFRGTFKKFLAACNSSKNTGLPQFFSNVSDNCILRASIIS